MSKRILVVEDQEDNRKILNDLLIHAGYEVLNADNGVDGVALAQSAVPDLILMDVMLPDLNGYEATRSIRSLPVIAHVPVIAVTSYALDGEQEKALAAGCDAYFSKPVSPRRLLARIRELIGDSDAGA